MAQTKLVEPRVLVTEKIHDYPIMLDIDGSTNIGGVIVAPTGPRLAYVAGPKDFLDKYTVDGEIPRNADITFLNAYYLSFAAGLVIARSMNTTAVNGIYFTTASQSSLNIYLSFENESLWGVQLGDKYYFCNDGDANVDSFIDVIYNLTKEDGSPTYSSSFVKHLTDNKASMVACTVDTLASTIKTNLGDGFNGSIIYSSSIGGLVISPSTDQLLIENDDYNVGVTVASEKTDGSKSLVGHTIDFKDEQPLTEKETLTIQLTEGFDSNWAFAYGTMAYYHGAINKKKYEDYSLKQVTSLDDIMDSIAGITGMNAKNCKYDQEEDDHGVVTKINGCTIDIEYSKGNKLYLPEGTALNCNVSLSDTESNSTYTGNKMLFAVYPNDPQDSNKYKIQIQPDDNNLFLLTTDDGYDRNSYTVSLVADAVDQDGSNAFIENLNALGTGFTFITNPNFKEGDNAAGEDSIQNSTPKATQVFSFGNSGLDLSSCKRVTNKVNALYALEDQEVYDIEYLAPFGETNLQFIKNYVLVGKNNDWFTPVDIPYSRTNANSIKGYFLNVDSTSNAQAMGPFDRNTGLTGWQFYLACSTLYYYKVMANTNAGKAWAPVFDRTNGVLDFTNPVYMLGKDDRTKLLNFKCPVNFLKYNQRYSVYYLNDNWTHQYERNIVSEEQNRRLVNKIKKDWKRLMDSFKGRVNTETTRNDVISIGNLYFQQNIMNQNPEYIPEEYQIVCDTTNNTTDIITANKLAVTVRVRLRNAIKYIDVLTDVYPLGVDFTN